MAYWQVWNRCRDLHMRCVLHGLEWQLLWHPRTSQMKAKCQRNPFTVSRAGHWSSTGSFSSFSRQEVGKKKWTNKQNKAQNSRHSLKMCHSAHAQESRFEMPWLYCLQSLLFLYLQSTHIALISKPPPCTEQFLLPHLISSICSLANYQGSNGWRCWIISTKGIWHFQYHHGNFFPLKF